MKTKVISAIAALLTLSVLGQGTFVYDQQSSIDGTPPPQGIGWASLQDVQSGQSFTPNLGGVDFIKLMLNDVNPNDALGVTVHLTLRSGAITGPILAATAPLLLPNTFGGAATFYFSGATVPVTPGSTYYFNVVADTGGPFQIFGSTTYNYTGGTAFSGTFPSQNADLWFREGIIVPEPSSAAILLLGGLVFAVRRRPVK